MKIKVGNNTYDSQEEPIMVILNDQDKENIKNMHPECTMYACFPYDKYTKEEIEKFMTT